METLSPRVSLRFRLGFIYLIVILLFVTAAYLTVHTFNFVVVESNAVIAQDDAVIRGLERVRQEIDQTVKISRLALAGEASTALSLQKRDTIPLLLEELKKFALAGEVPYMERIESNWGVVLEALDKMKARPGSIGFIFNKKILPALADMGQAISEMISMRREISFERVQKIRGIVQESRAYLMFFASIMILTGLSIAWAVRRYVLYPLRLLRGATEFVARGDLSHRVKPPHSDELGDVINSFNDMSDRLAEDERIKKEFVSLVAHEMRTPVTIIRGYAQLLTAPPENVAETSKAEWLESIYAETLNLQELTDDLFDMASAEAGMFKIEPEDTDLAKELLVYLKPFEQIALAKGISFEYDISALPDAAVDKKRVGQAVRNLVVNALKFTPSGGRISVLGKAEKDGDEIVIEVADDGPGIAPDELNNIFTRFYQIKIQEGESRRGIGLGLAIVREIALAHGGEVSVESEIGKGTVFRIVIPNSLPALLALSAGTQGGA